MAKIKIIKAEYNEETLETNVVLQTKIGKFTGYTKVHEEDKDIASNFLGCSIAEMRAFLKYQKARLNEFKNNEKILAELKNNMEKLKDYNKNSREARFIRKQYYIAREKVQIQKQNIKNYEHVIETTISSYRIAKENLWKKIKKIQEKRQNGEQQND